MSFGIRQKYIFLKKIVKTILEKGGREDIQ